MAGRPSCGGGCANASVNRALLSGWTTRVRGFGPMILKRLPIRSVVVASRNDDRVTFERATEFARAWGATLVDAGYQGHMGSAAQLGIWPRGLLWFGQFLAALKAG